MDLETDTWFLRSSQAPSHPGKRKMMDSGGRTPRTPALSFLRSPLQPPRTRRSPAKQWAGEWAGRVSPGPIESESPRLPGRWTQLDPGGGRRRRGQSRGRGGGGARGLEAEPRAVSPAPAAAAATAAAVPYLLWPGWLPALPLAARRPGIPSHLPSCWPGAQVRLAAQPRPRVLLGIVLSRGRPLRAVSAPRLPWSPGGGPGGRDDRLPIPPTPPGAAPVSGVAGPSLRILRVGLVPSTPIPGRLHNPWVWGRGSLPEPRPDTCPRNTLPGRGQRPSATAGPGKFHFVVRVC